MQEPFTLRILVSIIVLFTACAPTYTKYISGYETGPVRTAPDYSRLTDWAAHPWKKDLSDSIPQPLKKEYRQDSTVDVFFLHPTTFTRQDTGWNAALNDAEINAKTDYGTILFQASVFNEWRLFSPRYRQAHIRSYFTTDTAKAVAAFDLAYTDIKNAFQYYLDHYNQGRPIIIASHSQGSTHAQRLLKEFFDTTMLRNRLVAAYVIGMYMPENTFTNLPPCLNANQTGCVVGWRTVRTGYAPDYILAEKIPSIVVNPLTWSADTTIAGYELNKGSILRNFNKLQKGVTNAAISRGVLNVDRLHITGGRFLKMKNFHIGDINLFYVNIRQNLRDRVAAFWKR